MREIHINELGKEKRRKGQSLLWLEENNSIRKRIKGRKRRKGGAKGSEGVQRQEISFSAYEEKE